MKAFSILIVEDEGIAALALQESLELSGYRVTGSASSGSEAMELLEQERPDLVLMDINLQEKEEGIFAGEKIMKEYDIPVVFLTAYADRATISKAKEVFPYGYMVKPYSEPELYAVIETAIHKHLADKKQRELHQVKDKFYSIVAHDLRSPLAALAFTTRLLNRKIDELPREEIKEFIEEIHETVQNINQFTENLLEWTRSQSGKLQVYAEPLLLADIVDEAFVLLKGRAKEKEILLKSSVKEELVVADKNMLRSILLNLLQNGMKFTLPGGAVQVNSKREENQVMIQVKDNGIGMSEEQLEQLFDFKTSRHTLGTSEEKGTGLGLLLCKEFVEANGGEIEVKSRQGEGTEVLFTLPAVPVQNAEAPADPID